MYTYTFDIYMIPIIKRIKRINDKNIEEKSKYSEMSRRIL